MSNYMETDDTDLVRYAGYVQSYEAAIRDYLQARAKCRAHAYVAVREVAQTTDLSDPLALAAYEATLVRIEAV